MVVAFQLALTGVHELSEAMWIWSSKTEMASIGPIVRNEVFFFAVILGVAALLVLREWFGARRAAEDKSELNSAERRMREWELRRQRRWSFAAAILCIGGDRVAGGGVCVRARGECSDAGKDASMRSTERSSHSAFGADGSEPALLHRGRERHGDALPGDSPNQRRLRDGARCLPDLRARWATGRKARTSSAAIAARRFTFRRSASTAAAIRFR